MTKLQSISFAREVVLSISVAQLVWFLSVDSLIFSLNTIIKKICMKINWLFKSFSPSKLPFPSFKVKNMLVIVISDDYKSLTFNFFFTKVCDTNKWLKLVWSLQFLMYTDFSTKETAVKMKRILIFWWKVVSVLIMFH